MLQFVHTHAALSPAQHAPVNPDSLPHCGVYKIALPFACTQEFPVHVVGEEIIGILYPIKLFKNNGFLPSPLEYQVKVQDRFMTVSEFMKPTESSLMWTHLR